MLIRLSACGFALMIVVGAASAEPPPADIKGLLQKEPINKENWPKWRTRQRDFAARSSPLSGTWAQAPSVAPLTTGPLYSKRVPAGGSACRSAATKAREPARCRKDTGAEAPIRSAVTLSA